MCVCISVHLNAGAMEATGVNPPGTWVPRGCDPQCGHGWWKLSSIFCKEYEPLTSEPSLPPVNCDIVILIKNLITLSRIISLKSVDTDFFFLRQFSVSPGCPGTPSVDKAGLYLTEVASASRVETKGMCHHTQHLSPYSINSLLILHPWSLSSQ